MDSNKIISIGKVSWFGGTNRNTGKVNSFGFISSYLSEDFYVHKDDLLNGNLVADQFVIFEEQRQKNDKKSAKKVQILFPKGEGIPDTLLRLLSTATITNVVAVDSYKSHLVDWLNGHHSKVILSQFKKLRKINSSHLELIKLSKNFSDLFSSYVKKYSITDLFGSNLSPDQIPLSYLITNFQEIIAWWETIDDLVLKESLLESGISFLIRRTTYLRELSKACNNEYGINLIRRIHQEFPFNAKFIQVINKIDDQNRLLNEYIKTASLDDLIDNKISISLLPETFLKHQIEEMIESIKCSVDISEKQLSKQHFELILSQEGYIESLLLGCKDEISFIIAEQLNKKFPFNETILSCLKDSKQIFLKYNGSYCLEDYFKKKLSITLLPEWYVNNQVDGLFEDLSKANFIRDKGLSKNLLAFVLSSLTYRKKAIKSCEIIHLTNIYNVIQLLGYQDKLIEIKLLENLTNKQCELSDIPSLLPLLANENRVLIDEFTYKNIKLISDWLRSLSNTERQRALEISLNYFDTSCLLALIFEDALNTTDISERITEVDKFVLSVLRKQKFNVADYVRKVYKSCFSSFDCFSNNQVIKPLFESNKRLIKMELIKWKIYNKDLSFVTDIESDDIIESDPEYWFLSKLLPLVNPDNSYDTIQKIIIHELWQALLSEHIKVDHPSIFKLFPQCNTLMNYRHMDLSCEAFSWQPKPNADDSSPKAKYLCRSKICDDPKVLPNLNKSYLDYSAFDWLAHYGVHYIRDNAPAKSDFPIKLAGYLNRIRELHERLHCRSCQKLMVPNMKYARVEAITIDPSTGNKVSIPVNAAYRLTVFQCNNLSCTQHGIGHYINHCLGFKCYEIIDSRDLQEKCSEGRYICQNPECRSCCPKHTSTPEHGIGDSVIAKHKELYIASPHFKSFRK